jgi:hypothetical protein
VRVTFCAFCSASICVIAAMARMIRAELCIWETCSRSAAEWVGGLIRPDRACFNGDHRLHRSRQSKPPSIASGQVHSPTPHWTPSLPSEPEIEWV